MADPATSFVMKIVTGVIAAALIASFGWILKVEVGLTAARADIEDLESDIVELKDDLKDAKSIAAEVRANKVDLTRVVVTLDGIKDDVTDIKNALAASP